MSEAICLLGFGEVGRTLARDLDRTVAAYDVLFADPMSGPSVDAAAMESVGVAGSAGEAVAGADTVVSVVTASEAVVAAESVAGALGAGAFFVDMNSVSPGTRRRTAAVVEAAGGRFVEAVVMSPIAPRGIASPILLGGPHAAAFAPVARSLGFSGAAAYSDELGAASAAKMSRSVVVKGLEALLAESLATARRFGVEDTVLASLSNVLPLADGDWASKAEYMIGRSIVHGARRAEEMREVAATVAEAGVDPWMSRATGEREAWASTHRSSVGGDLTDVLDAFLGRHDG